MRSEWLLRLMSGVVLVGVFAAGVLFGAGITRHQASPPHPPPGPIEAMNHELDLDAHQRDQLRAIADAHRGELETIMRETQPRLRKVLDSIEQEMTPNLRPDQVQKLEAWRKRRPPPPMPGLGPPPPDMGPPGGPPPEGPPAGGAP